MLLTSRTNVYHSNSHSNHYDYCVECSLQIKENVSMHSGDLENNNDFFPIVFLLSFVCLGTSTKASTNFVGAK